MITINVKEALDKLKNAEKQLSGKQLATATSRSINETILKARTDARKEVKALYNIPQKNLAGINIHKATVRTLSANLYASASPIPMDAFSPRFQTPTKSITVSRKGEQKERQFKKPKKNISKGVSIEVLKGKRESVPYAFMVAGAAPRVFARGEYRKGGTYGFIQRFKRVNKEGNDTPIKPLVSVTVHAAVVNDKALDTISKGVIQTFPGVFDRNLNFLLNNMNK